MTDRLKTYDEALDWLFFHLPSSASEIFKADKSYEISAKLLKTIGNPQNNYRTVHVAGTSGKGSTVALTSKLLELSGKQVGSIYSPHVYDFRERFTVNDSFVDKSEVLEATRKLKKVIDGLNAHKIFPNYFQAVVALAYLIFDNYDLDYLVVETGFGGLFDATNHITRDDKVVLLNSIGLDHTQVLGDTLEKIAFQKAGIITPDSTVFALSQSEAVNQVFETQAKSRGAGDFSLINQLSLGGKYPNEMEMNMALALKACESVAKRDGWNFNSEVIDKAASQFHLSGRFEERRYDDRAVILDGAHNLQKIEMLLDSLRFKYPHGKFNLVFASAKKRKPQDLLMALKPVIADVYLTKYSAFGEDSRRSAIDFSRYDHIIEGAKVVNDVDKLVDVISHSSDNWLVTGSFFLVSEIGQKLH